MNIKQIQGALFSFLGFTLFACGDALTKIAGLNEISPTLMIMISGWSVVLTTIIYSIYKKDIKSLKPKNMKIHFILSCIFIALSYVAIYSFTNLPLTTVYIGLFSAPSLISIFGVVFLKEKITRVQISAIIIGFLGVLIAIFPEIITQKDTVIGNPIIGYVALPFFLGLYVLGMLLMNHMGKTETAESITFVSFGFRAVLLTPILFFEPISNISLSSLLYMIGMGVTAGIGFIFMAKAYQLAPVSIVSPFHYTQLVTGAIFGYLIWNTIPSYWVFAGGILIIASGIMIAHEAHIQSKEKIKS